MLVNLNEEDLKELPLDEEGVSLFWFGGKRS